VTYNSERLLPDLIDGLRTGLEGIDWHLTVADNASADDSVATVRKLAPEATIVEMGRNAGYAAGINAAVRAAPPHDAVLVLNPDVRLTEGCMTRLLAALRLPGTGIAVPHIVDGTGALIPTMRREPSVLRTLGDAFLGARRAGRYPMLGEVVTDERRYAVEAFTDWAEGSTMLISGECWERCAPWDESFFLYSEETDFCLRARDRGWLTRYEPTAVAMHLGGGSGRSVRTYAMQVINRVRLYRRRHAAVASWAYYGLLLLREALYASAGAADARAATVALLRPSRRPPELGCSRGVMPR
jgi:GT2 family glycosyltransferase